MTSKAELHPAALKLSQSPEVRAFFEGKSAMPPGEPLVRERQRVYVPCGRCGDPVEIEWKSCPSCGTARNRRERRKAAK